MNCETARARLLEADLTELQGEGELAVHLQSCARCRRQAQVIVARYATLRTALERYTPGLDPADQRWRKLVPGTRVWRPGWPVLVPVALAASLAILVLTRRQQSKFEPSMPRVASVGARLDVQGAPGQTVAVFQTDNPNIVIIWSF